MGRDNRRAGHDYEREIRKELQDLLDFTGAEFVTSRSESRRKDNVGIDLFDVNNIIKESIQTKTKVNQPKIHEFFEEKEADVFIWKKTEKKGKRFFNQGEYVIMKKELFYHLIKEKYV